MYATFTTVIIKYYGNFFGSKSPVSFQTDFPFDGGVERDRENPFRSQLDDLAQRHPEFAEHLNLREGSFPFRNHLRDRNRWGSESASPRPSGSNDPFDEYRRFADRPFGSRFERFPSFGRGFEERSFSPTNAQNQQPQSPPQPPPQQQQQQQQKQPPPAQPTVPPQVEKETVAPQEERKGNPTLVQSNTVDLGQKQEPVDDKRNQRSMSAPPDNRNPHQRFVSTCNIPMNREAGGGDTGPTPAQPQEQKGQQQTHQSRGNERVIPIHVEGRDEPVIPKNVHQTFTQQSPQPERVFGRNTPPPQPERVFGHNPSHFTQFLNRDRPDAARAEFFKQFQNAPSPPPKQHTNFQQQQSPNFQQPQPNFQQQQQAQKPQQQPQQQTPPPPQETTPHSSKLAPTEQIQAIQKDVLELMTQVENFTGKYRDKQYLYLDEMLTRNLLKLDNIETEGKDAIRQARREAIKCIERCIGILEAKAAANENATREKTAPVAEGESMEIDGVKEQNADPSSNLINAEQQQIAMEAEPIKALEVSGVARSGTPAEGGEVAPMEVETAKATDAQNSESRNNGEAIPLPPPPTEEAGNGKVEENKEKTEDKKEKKKNKKKDKSEKK